MAKATSREDSFDLAAEVLVIDIGNSRVKWALASAAGLSSVDAASHQGAGLSAAARSRFLALNPPRAVIAASVARSAVTETLESLVRARWGLPIRYLSVLRQGHGIVCGYHQPRQLGVDRWVALVGARDQVAGAVGVVDVGTAITLDFLDANGLHLGGVILPGLELMRRSLSTGTEQLQLVRTGAPEVFAKDTGDAIYAGTTLAVAGAIDAVREHMQTVAHTQASWLLTGGAVAEIQPFLKAEYRYLPNLVLEGMRCLAGSDIAKSGETGY